jgi:hypothetical protein
VTTTAPHVDGSPHLEAASPAGALDDIRPACSTGSALERMDDAPQLDLEALWGAVSEPTAPVVEHRRRVA